MPAMPEEAEEGVLKGMYKLRPAPIKGKGTQGASAGQRPAAA